jgi:hypothetical protein
MGAEIDFDFANQMGLPLQRRVWRGRVGGSVGLDLESLLSFRPANCAIRTCRV